MTKVQGGGLKKTMVCCSCAMRIDATIRQAKRHGWELWVGGARCKACVHAQSCTVEEWIHGVAPEPETDCDDPPLCCGILNPEPAVADRRRDRKRGG